MINLSRCFGLLICILFVQCKAAKTTTTHSMLKGNWKLTETQILSRGYKPPEVPVPVPDQQLIFDDSEFRLSEKGKEEEVFTYEIREMQFQNDPIRYIIESLMLRGEIHFYGSDSLSIGDKGSCAVITHYRRIK